MSNITKMYKVIFSKVNLVKPYYLQVQESGRSRCMGYSRHQGHQATKERFSLVSGENSEGFEFVGVVICL